MSRVKIIGDRSGRVWPLVLRAAEESRQAGRKMILYVPEQMTLQAERDLILGLGLPGLLETQVISPRKLVMQVSEHLGRATAKPYRVPSMTVEGGLWVSVVRLVYITVFGAILTILASATHLFFKHRDIEQFRPFKGRPCCDAFAELYVMPEVEVISVFIRIEFFSHKNISV